MMSAQRTTKRIESLFNVTEPAIADGRWLGVRYSPKSGADRPLDLWTFRADAAFDRNCLWCRDNLSNEPSGERFQAGLPSSLPLATFAFVRTDDARGERPFFPFLSSEKIDADTNDQVEGNLEVLHTECALTYAYQSLVQRKEIQAFLTKGFGNEQKTLGSAMLNFSQLVSIGARDQFIELMDRASLETDAEARNPNAKKRGVVRALQEFSARSDTKNVARSILTYVTSVSNLIRIITMVTKLIDEQQAALSKRAEPASASLEQAGLAAQKQRAAERNFLLEIVVQVRDFVRALGTDGPNGLTVYEEAIVASPVDPNTRQPIEIIVDALRKLTALGPSALDSQGRTVLQNLAAGKRTAELVQSVATANPRLVDALGRGVGAQDTPLGLALSAEPINEQAARLLIETFNADVNLSRALQRAVQAKSVSMVTFLLAQESLRVDNRAVRIAIELDWLEGYELFVADERRVRERNVPSNDDDGGGDSSDDEESLEQLNPWVDNTDQYPLAINAQSFDVTRAIAKRRLNPSGDDVIRNYDIADENRVGDTEFPYLELLFELGYDVNAQTTKLPNDTDESLVPGTTLLLRWITDASGRAMSILPRLLEVPGIDLDLADEKGGTPLTRTIWKLNNEQLQRQVFELLLEKGADPNKPGVDSQSPIILLGRAVFPDGYELLSKVASLNPLVQTTDGRTALHMAVRVTGDNRENIRIANVQEIVRLWPQLLSVTDNAGDTPLQAARRVGRSEALISILTRNVFDTLVQVDDDRRRALRKRKLEVQEAKKKRLKINCELCPETARHICNKCGGAAYCSAQCQQEHWKSTHYQECTHLKKIDASLVQFQKGTLIKRDSKDRTQDIVLDAQLGAGSFGQVWTGARGTKRFIVKLADLNDRSSANLFVSEVLAHRLFAKLQDSKRFCSRNARCGVESFIDAEQPNVAVILFSTPPFPTSDLNTFVQQRLPQIRPDELRFQQVVRTLALDFLDDVATMHERQLVHRDLKLENALVDERFVALEPLPFDQLQSVLIDFGTATALDTTSDLVFTTLLDERSRVAKRLAGIRQALSAQDRAMVFERTVDVTKPGALLDVVPGFVASPPAIGTPLYVDPSVAFDAAGKLTFFGQQFNPQTAVQLDRFAAGATLYFIETLARDLTVGRLSERPREEQFRWRPPSNPTLQLNSFIQELTDATSKRTVRQVYDDLALLDKQRKTSTASQGGVGIRSEIQNEEQERAAMLVFEEIDRSRSTQELLDSIVAEHFNSTAVASSIEVDSLDVAPIASTLKEKTVLKASKTQGGGEIVLVKQLGAGATGAVWKAVERKTKTGGADNPNVIVKLFNVDSFTTRDEFIREVFAHKTLLRQTRKSKNLCLLNARCGMRSFVNTQKSPARGVIVFPASVVAPVDLFDFISSRIAIDLKTIRNEEDARKRTRALRSLNLAILRIARDIVQDVNALHKNGLAHRDVKPENILVDRVLVDRGILEPEFEETGVLIDFNSTYPFEPTFDTFVDESTALRGIDLLTQQSTSFRTAVKNKRIPSEFADPVVSGTPLFFDADFDIMQPTKKRDELIAIDGFAVGATLYNLETLQLDESLLKLLQRGNQQQALAWRPPSNDSLLLNEVIQGLTKKAWRQRLKLDAAKQKIDERIKEIKNQM